MSLVTKMPVSVYYNSACTVCRSGINMQMNKMALCCVEWKDVHSDNGLVKELNEGPDTVRLTTIRKYLYVTHEKKIYVGVNAFIKLWENSPKETWKARVVSLPVVKQFFVYAYYIFANVLYCFNKVNKKW